MILKTGARLGRYEILALIGRGGMGEVYRAQDTKLGREVALKVLPETFARDPDRLARFRREVHLLASLNHANIAAIYGLEDANGLHFLVWGANGEIYRTPDNNNDGRGGQDLAYPERGQAPDAV